MTREETDEMRHGIRAVRDRFMTQKMKDIDLLLCPGYYHCALKDENKSDLGFTAQYLLLFNLLDMPAGTVPVTKVNEEEEKQEYKDSFNDFMTKAINKDIKKSKGMPIGVQIVGKTYEDEKVVALMKAL